VANLSGFKLANAKEVAPVERWWHEFYLVRSTNLSRLYKFTGLQDHMMIDIKKAARWPLR